MENWEILINGGTGWSGILVLSSSLPGTNMLVSSNTVFTWDLHVRSWAIRKSLSFTWRC